MQDEIEEALKDARAYIRTMPGPLDAMDRAILARIERALEVRQIEKSTRSGEQHGEKL